MSSRLIDQIPAQRKVSELNAAELEKLCDEIREYLISTILEHGGHFSGNLGVVELTVALHHLMDLPTDRLIWDVGHQSYPHKILTGRKDALPNIRKQGGISGFPKRSESEYDAFGTGHSSTSISAALGFAYADKLQGRANKNVAVIGDGSLTGGMAWEALSNAGVSDLPLTIIINDNDIGIDPNQGAIGHYLNKLHRENSSAHSNIFTDWNFEYFVVRDGHDLDELIPVLKDAFKCKGPQVVHIKTVKGKGFEEAEQEQTKWHAVKYVKIRTANNENGSNKGAKFQDVFGKKLLSLARENKKLVAITPAMPSGSSLNFMMDEIPERVFDVGIAEQHAITFSAGLAAGGLKPFCCIYSSFFQRGYDQYLHDVALQNLNVTFFLDRAGIVGADGPTHHGLYDIAFLRGLPNTVIAAPLDGKELEATMDFAMEYNEGPFIIRYPRGRTSQLVEEESTPIEIGKGRKIRDGKKVAVLSLGSIGDQALLAWDILAAENKEFAVYDMRFASPIDEHFLTSILQDYEHVITIENGTLQGGFGSAVIEAANGIEHRAKITTLGFPKEIIEHAKPRELFSAYKLDYESVAGLVRSFF